MDISEQLCDKHVLVTEACTPFGTNIALRLALQGMHVTLVSSLGKDVGELRCGIETDGVSKLLVSPFYHLPKVTLNKLKELRERMMARPLYSVIVIDPLKGSQHALENAKRWSDAFSPTLEQDKGTLGCCPFIGPRDVGLWQTFLKGRYKNGKTPQHNVVCFGQKPSKVKHCTMLKSEMPVLWNALFATSPRIAEVSLIEIKK